MSLTTASVELASALKTARIVWEDTLEVWKDPVSRDFQSQRWEPLVSQVEATLGAIDRLAPILARAMRECS
jgi:hypothetical protein